MSARPNLKRAFDHPGLFMVRLDRLRTMPAAEETLALSGHEGPLRARRRGTVIRKQRARHRYCSTCARETEHAGFPGRGPANIPSIRWPAAERASGTTICLSCGQWRGAASEASPPAWSTWPRQPTPPIARRSLAEADSDPLLEDEASEAAAENEGMPPRRERSSTRALLQRAQLAEPGSRQ